MMSDDVHRARMQAGAGTMALMDALDAEGLELLTTARENLAAFADRLEAAGVPRLAALGGIVSLVTGVIMDRPEGAT